MSSPWKTQTCPPAGPSSLRDIMSEQLAVDEETQEDRDLALALKESLELEQAAKSVDDCFASQDDVSTDCTSDELLARMLQEKFDDEYCQAQPRDGRTINHPVKICPAEDLEDDEILDEQAEHIKAFESAVNFGSKGYANINGQIVTKHDPEISGHRNMQKITDNMPLSFPCGDAHTSKMPLSNKIYNELRRSAHKDEKRSRRQGEKKEKSTAEKAMDESTRVSLQKAINSGLVDSYGGIIATGKEAVVIHATGGTSKPEEFQDCLPAEMAVKVFKTTLNEFKNRQDYIAEDYRFKDRFKKINPRKMIRMWCEKELFNLKLLLRAGIPCPEPVTIKKHVLFMRFIGDNGIPANRLKDVQVNKEKTKTDIMTQVIELGQKMFQKAKIVHADFSEFNMLYYQKRVYVIDVSQAVPREHPMALRFLLRDCQAIHRFFAKSWQMTDVPSPEAIFNEVTGYNFGRPDPETPFVPTDQVLFSDQLEAAVLEIQRKHKVERNQFNSDFGLGREDDFHDNEEDIAQTDDWIEFLNHLSDLNARNVSNELESGDESPITDEESTNG